MIEAGTVTLDEQGNDLPEPKPRRKHEWGPSQLNHGAAQCIHCHCTDREATFALGPYCPEN